MISGETTEEMNSGSGYLNNNEQNSIAIFFGKLLMSFDIIYVISMSSLSH